MTDQTDLSDFAEDEDIIEDDAQDSDGGKGHNTNPELDSIAKDAKDALKSLKSADSKGLDSWVKYGKALARGRAIHTSDEQFGAWIKENSLDVIGKFGKETLKTNAHERSAAIWSATNPDQFELMKKNHPVVFTVRGLHAKWKAYVRETIAGAGLYEIEDTEEFATEAQALAEKHGFEFATVVAETDKIRTKLERETKAKEEREKQQEEMIAGVRAEIESELDLDPGTIAKLSETAASQIGEAMSAVLMQCTANVLRSSYRASSEDSLRLNVKDHPSLGWHLSQSGLCKSTNQAKEWFGSMEELTDEVAESIVKLAMNGKVLPGYINPPVVLNDMLSPDFAAEVWEIVFVDEDSYTDAE